jgi:CheY-like chemotaxis protein
MTHETKTKDTPCKTVPKRILIVEDEVLIAFGAMADLEDEGYEVVIANDGRRGLEAATHQPFDLIITDYMMPRMNGLEMIDAIRRAGVMLPIVLATSIDEAALPRLQRAGYDLYLPKPYRTRDIRAAAECFGDDFTHQSVSRPLATKAGVFAYETC